MASVNRVFIEGVLGHTPPGPHQSKGRPTLRNAQHRYDTVGRCRHQQPLGNRVASGRRLRPPG